jgi:hypothetical protein
MDHPLMDTSQWRTSQVADATGRGTLAPLDEARGVLRDALAALRNVEHLLRSPKVGSRALAKVIPGLHGVCDPLIGSIDDMLVHVRVSADAPVDEALAAVASFVEGMCQRLRAALDRAGRLRSLDAKSRLSFEGAIARAGIELNSVRQLLDLLIRATSHCDTELDLEELVQVAFATPASSVNGREVGTTVIATYASDGSGFQASPQVFMPLLAVAIASVRGADSSVVYLEAVCRQGEPVVVTVSREGLADGDVLCFHPPVMTEASLICAETAARLAGGEMRHETGRVVLSWPRPAG